MLRPDASREFEQESCLCYSYTREGAHLPYASRSIRRTIPRPFACACVRQQLTLISRRILIIGLLLKFVTAPTMP